MPEQPAGDKERFQASLTRLWEIYKDIGAVANEVSTWRCPYKNARDRCTAKTSPSPTGPASPLTTDYRSAWELGRVGMPLHQR